MSYNAKCMHYNTELKRHLFNEKQLEGAEILAEEAAVRCFILSYLYGGVKITDKHTFEPHEETNF